MRECVASSLRAVILTVKTSVGSRRVIEFLFHFQRFERSAHVVTGARISGTARFRQLTCTPQQQLNIFWVTIYMRHRLWEANSRRAGHENPRLLWDSASHLFPFVFPTKIHGLYMHFVNKRTNTGTHVLTATAQTFTISKLHLNGLTPVTHFDTAFICNQSVFRRTSLVLKLLKIKDDTTTLPSNTNVLFTNTQRHATVSNDWSSQVTGAAYNNHLVLKYTDSNSKSVLVPRWSTLFCGLSASLHAGPEGLTLPHSFQVNFRI